MLGDRLRLKMSHTANQFKLVFQFAFVSQPSVTQYLEPFIQRPTRFGGQISKDGWLHFIRLHGIVSLGVRWKNQPVIIEVPIFGRVSE